MGLIPDDIIRQVRDQTDIVDVINQYTQLTKKGQHYVASCPFHEDKNPSFSVHTGKQIFKCFSCGRGGNVFGFLQEIEGLSFPEAVRKAAEFSDLPINFDLYLGSDQSPQQQTHQRLLDLHEKTQDFYQYFLNDTTNGQPALDYLLNRNLNEDTLTTFGLGLSPQKSELLVEYLSNEGFSKQELLDSGIFYLNDREQIIDRFHGRIIYPLRNAQAKVIAFSGRRFTTEQTEDKAIAKYLNSPETALFNKSDLIYNFDLARLPARQKGQMIVCEGYMDVMSLYQAGYQHVVATMGTSLTQQHLDRLIKVAKEIIFVFDGDQAGQKAIARALQMGQNYANCQFKAVIIPNRLDPDEWIKAEGASSFQILLDQAISAFDFNRHYLKSQYNLQDEQELARYLEALIQLIAQISSPIEQEIRLQDLSQEYNLSLDILKEQFIRYKQSLQNNQTKPLSIDERQASFHPSEEERASAFIPEQSFEILSARALQSEKQLILLLTHFKEAWDYVAQLNKPVLFVHPYMQLLYFKLQEFYYDLGNPLPLTGVVDSIENPAMLQLMNNLLWDGEPMTYHNQIIDDCLQTIEEEFILLEIKEKRARLLELKKEQNHSEMNLLLADILRLTRQVKKK
ncbi:DNA primase [Vaginisenegalia massiliensis]|uniref:DNA primase n=1 Tax=Vaginisenegalia massiliensis TaxID=2058294 RepID=UPI000F52F595|nr:DNA primase [Vaginisenegalia massiliensis]